MTGQDGGRAGQTPLGWMLFGTAVVAFLTVGAVLVARRFDWALGLVLGSVLAWVFWWHQEDDQR